MAEASAATTIHVVPVMRHIVVAALASAMLVVIVFPTLQQPCNGNDLRVGTSRDRIELPRNAIRVVEADVLVMGLWIFLNPMVAYPCRV